MNNDIMTRSIREKRHRLPPEAYKGCTVVAFTINVKERQKLFVKDNVFHVFEEMLLAELEHYHCSAYVYLFMPDHLHAIIAGEQATSDVKRCVEIFKQKTGFWLYENMPDLHWQKDYYDHIIRDDEDLNAQIRYVLYNPQRAGLVALWRDYPYKGSTKFEFDKFGEPM